jgi:hypothetical protein
MKEVASIWFCRSSLERSCKFNGRGLRAASAIVNNERRFVLQPSPDFFLM